MLQRWSSPFGAEQTRFHFWSVAALEFCRRPDLARQAGPESAQLLKSASFSLEARRQIAKLRGAISPFELLELILSLKPNLTGVVSIKEWV